METLVLDVSNPLHIARAAELLRGSGTVAFPTETVYGLGANALAADAVARIFAAKQRPSWDPLIVHVPDYAAVLPLVQMDREITHRVEKLAEAFWPGPLTLLLPRRSIIPDAVTAGRPLVGIRLPAHAAAQSLLRAVRLPLAAPSANRFGHTSPTTAQHVLDDLDGRIGAVLDAGATSIGLESTVLDPTTKVMTLYRPGALTPEQLESVTGAHVTVFKPAHPESGTDATAVQVQEALPAPGVGLRHYAPNARLILVEGNAAALQVALDEFRDSSNHLGVLLPTDWKLNTTQTLVERWGMWDDPAQLAATLFSGLRGLDAHGAQVILCPLPAPGGLRNAIRDRLQKAARS